MCGRCRTAIVLVVALCLAVVVVMLAGCCIPIAPSPSGGGGFPDGGPAEKVEPDIPSPEERIEEERFTDDVTIVPDVLGLYYDEAAAKIEAAGLQPVDVSIHGPIDEDAGEIGKVYRQTPNAGDKVAPGSKVELRSWWESQ